MMANRAGIMFAGAATESATAARRNAAANQPGHGQR